MASGSEYFKAKNIVTLSGPDNKEVTQPKICIPFLTHFLLSMKILKSQKRAHTNLDKDISLRLFYSVNITPRPQINCSWLFDDNTVLVGTEQGLFALLMHKLSSGLISVPGLKDVHSIHGSRDCGK